MTVTAESTCLLKGETQNLTRHYSFRVFCSFACFYAFVLQVLNITRSVIRFFNLVSLMLLVAHWNGCMQFLVPVLDDFPDDSWVMLHDLRVC